MATPKTGLPEGRPPKTFLDPNRYAIGMADGLECLGLSQRVAYDMAAVAAGGWPCSPTKRPRGKCPDEWTPAGFALPITVSVAGRSSTLLKKTKKFELVPEAAAWRIKMGLAFAIAMNPKRGAEFRQLADAIVELASAVNERAFAESTLLPMLLTKILTPEFFPRV